MYIVLVAFLVSFTAFLIHTQKQIKKARKEMHVLVEYADSVEKKLADEDYEAECMRKNSEELDNMLCNIKYRLDNMKYPEDKLEIIELDLRKKILAGILEGRELKL